MNIDYKKNLPYLLILLVGVGGLCLGGYEINKSSKAKTGSAQTVDAGANQGMPNSQNSGGQRGQWGSGGNRGNFTRLHGTVTSVGDSSIVMKADDGASKNLSVSSDTRITKMDNGQRATLAISDVKSGDEINVMASDTSQSTITPRMIIIGAFTPPQGGQYQGSGGNTQDNYSSPSGSSSSQQI